MTSGPQCVSAGDGGRFRADAPQEGGGGGEHQLPVVGHHVVEASLGVGSVVTQVLGEQGAGEVRTDDGDAPLVGERVLRAQAGAEHTRERAGRHVLAQHDDELGPTGEAGVPAGGRGRELARVLEAGGDDGRPGPLPVPSATHGAPIVDLRATAGWRRTETPYELVAESRAVQRSTKPLLVAMSKHLERQALTLGGTAVVAASFQHARQLTPATLRRYRALAAGTELVVVLGEDVPDSPVPGVSGASLHPDDPLTQEWSIAVVGPHFAGAVLAKDLGDVGPDAERRFDYVVTYDRELVLTAAAALLRRVGSAPAALPR